MYEINQFELNTLKLVKRIAQLYQQQPILESDFIRLFKAAKKHSTLAADKITDTTRRAMNTLTLYINFMDETYRNNERELRDCYFRDYVMPDLELTVNEYRGRKFKVYTV
jgi:hypothetical protein